MQILVPAWGLKQTPKKTGKKQPTDFSFFVVFWAG
jgi:hypothetical protein